MNKIIINIFLGLIIGIFISYLFVLKFNYRIKGPDSNIIRKYVYEFNDDYYKFTPEICIKPYFM
jgi:hypothetical protein